MSGIAVSDELLALYEEVKLGSKHKFIQFSLVKQDDAGKSYAWSIDRTADPSEAEKKNEEVWNEVVAALPDDAPCFVVFDFVTTTADGRMVKKLVLVKWCPDTVHFRVKPVYGGTYQTLKDKLTGLGKDVQASERDELAYETILKMVA